MKKIVFAFVFMLIFFLSCAPVQYSRQRPAITHKYMLKVENINGNPLDGVKIDYTLTDDDKIVRTNSYVTTSDGILQDQLNVTSNSQSSYFLMYKSYLDYIITKDGYYSKEGLMSSYYDNDSSVSKQISTKTITFIRPYDYLNPDFASELSNIKLKNKIIDFIDLIIIEGLLSKSVLNTQSVDFVEFKNNLYLQFMFTNSNVYNSIKLNKYDIGKLMFDEVVRKILTPLNELFNESDTVYGYDLKIIGHTKSFINEYATTESIVYRFMIPKEIVKKYKNKDITGQQVLNSSIILMDDERIELKLQ